MTETPEPADHPFEHSRLDFCEHVVAVLDNHTVYCGLKKSQHLQPHAIFPPDGARDL